MTKSFLCRFTTALLAIIGSSEPSITGATYHDDLDFRIRYQKPYECDPLYYHPLHLPPRCAKMYQQEILGAIDRNDPIALFSRHPYIPASDLPVSSEESHKRVRRQILVVPPRSPMFWETAPMVLASNPEPDYFVEPVEKVKKIYPKKTPKIHRIPKTPYDEMIESINFDIASQPSQGIIKMSNIGPVTVYNQAVSAKSEQLIMKLAKSSLPNDSEEVQVPKKTDKKKEKKKKEKKKLKNKKQKREKKKKTEKKRHKL